MPYTGRNTTTLGHRFQNYFPLNDSPNNWGLKSANLNHYGDPSAIQKFGRFEATWVVEPYPMFTTDEGNWIPAPFGICTAVWNRIGSDTATGDLTTGWKQVPTEGNIQTVQFTVSTAGYYTMYLTVVKSVGPTTAQEFIRLFWIRPSDHSEWIYGALKFNEFADSQLINHNDDYPCMTHGYSETCYPAMTWPVTFKAPTSPTTFQVRFGREGWAQTSVWMARPIILSGVCAWINQ